MNVYGPRPDYQGAYIAVIMKMLDAIDRGESLQFLVMVQRHLILFQWKIVPKLMCAQ